MRVINIGRVKAAEFVKNFKYRRGGGKGGGVWSRFHFPDAKTEVLSYTSVSYTFSAIIYIFSNIKPI